jgi:hypothetical protein
MGTPPPFGWRAVEGCLEPDGEEHETLGRAHELRTAEMALLEHRRDTDQEGGKEQAMERSAGHAGRSGRAANGAGHLRPSAGFTQSVTTA